MWNLQNVTEPDKFNVFLGNLMNQVITQAVNNPKRFEISVDAEKRPQQLNLFLLGNYSANPSSNVNPTITFYTCQPENTVRIRR